MIELFSDYTIRTVTLGAMTLGSLCGVLGTFAVLRKQSLLGDTISHAALPGICMGFILFQTKSQIVLLLGAAIAGWLGMILVISILKTTHLKTDTALGLMLSIFFGFGLVLLTWIQKMPNAAQAGLDKYLFGQAAALLWSDVVQLFFISLGILCFVLMFWKEFKVIIFDSDFASSIGFPTRRIDLFLTTLLVLTIAIGLQMVGVVLISAMIVAPAAAARQWTDRLGVMTALSAIFGSIAGLSGSLISSIELKLPTGPLIVLSATTITILSIFFAPLRGLLWQWIHRQKQKKQLVTNDILRSLYHLFSQHHSLDHAHSQDVLQTMAKNKAAVSNSLYSLSEQGLVSELSPGQWALTQQGLSYIESKIHLEKS